jgi:hypothetical protein
MMPLPNFVTMQAQPDLLLTWLQNNLLISRNVNNNGLGAQWLTVTPFVHQLYGNTTGTDADGNAIDVYELTANNAGQNNGMRSFICNYAQHNVHQQDIDAHGDYCFTPNMNGCTFAIGQPNGGTITVAHANTGGNSAAQRQQISGVFGGLGNLKVLEPAAYRRVKPGSRINATTFGIRSGMTWTFYFQSWESVGNGTYLTYGVMPV